MAKCKLCLKKDADKKGSHIIPHFLLKRIENIEGKAGRDYEIGFAIEKLNTTSHFGRSVSPKKLDEVYGEVSDDDIEGNIHPLIVDHFFCSNCESRFAVIESEYSKSLSVIKDGSFETNINGALGFLFWSSIFWRMSINGKSGLRLNQEQEEVLRQILDISLKNDLSDIEHELDDIFVELENITYKLIQCCKYSSTNATYLLLHPQFDNPYSLLIDEYIVCLSINGSYEDYQTKDFFGLKDEINIAPINNGKNKELAYSISEDCFSKVCKELINHMKNIRVSYINNILDGLHISLGGSGTSMPDHIKQDIWNEITSTEKKLGRKHNLEDIKNSTMKVLKKYTH